MADGPTFPPDNYFNVFKYNRSKNTDSFTSPTSYQAQSGSVVSFLHEPSGKSVYFKAFIIAFNESYSSDWVSETVFGRTDPIQHFKQTTRRISLGLKIPAETDSEAFENLGRVQQLTQYLYPNYTTINNTQTLSQNPFVRLKVMNLAQKNIAEVVSDLSNAEYYKNYKSTADPGNGLLGVITNLNISHNLENNDVGVITKDSNTILPKMIEINLDFTVIHETQLGWNSEGAPLSPTGPYGIMAGPNAGEDLDVDPGTDGALTPEEKAKNEQQRLKAAERYNRMGGEARMKKDLMYLNKMAGKARSKKGLTAKQQANVAYLHDTLKGAGMGAEAEFMANVGASTDYTPRQRRAMAAGIVSAQDFIG